MSLFEKIREKIFKKKLDNSDNKKLEKISKNFFNNFSNKLFNLRKKFKENNQIFLEKFEELLISFDINYKHVNEIINNLKKELKRKKVDHEKNTNELICKKILSVLKEEGKRKELVTNLNGPSIYLIIGVNGSGKTSTCAKFGNYLKKQGKKVLLVAADTFRAAAFEQLSILGKKNNLSVFTTKQQTKDPSAIVYQALENIKDYDAIIVDTAGRLENKINLVKELTKIKKTISKRIKGSPHETLLILDSTVGQNGISQAKVFNEEIGISSIILTKLDGTSKGGVIFSIKKEFNLSPLFVTIGENIDDFVKFDSEFYLLKLIENLDENKNS